jgi:threonine dehydratase
MKDAIEAAHSRIAPHVRKTVCRSAPSLSEAVGGDVFVKLENSQHTGSFKLRGVVNKILTLPEEDSRKLLVAASTGNHAAAFAHALQVFGLRGMLFMPKNSSVVKVENVRSKGVPLELVGEDCVEAEGYAIEVARSNGGVWISPYNDIDVVHGQGTVGVELFDQLEDIDAVLAPVGGGGLISGIASYLKAVKPSIEIIGCQPINSCVMYESVKAGEILEIESLPTISDGTAGGIETAAMTFDLCRNHVDDFILLDEDEILHALRFLHFKEGLTIEGAAALPAAGVLKDTSRFVGRRTALIVSGGRVDDTIVARILDGGQGDDA